MTPFSVNPALEKMTAELAAALASNIIMRQALEELAKAHSPEWLLNGIGQDIAQAVLSSADKFPFQEATLTGFDSSGSSLTFSITSGQVAGATIGTTWFVRPAVVSV